MKNKKLYKYKAEIEVPLIMLPSSEIKEKMSTKASLDDLRKIIPNEVLGCDTLLPIALPSFSVNLPNLNGDIILAKEALGIYKKFINQPVNRAHIQANPIGHIVNAALTSYDKNYQLGFGNELLSEEDIKADMNQIFNVSLAAVLYWIVDSDFLQEVEESADSENSNYMKISASLELNFDDYEIMRGSEDITKAEFITDEDEKEELKSSLKVFRGSGVDKNNKPIYRVIKGEIDPAGIGLIRRNRKAGTVQGLVVAENKNDTTTCQACQKSFILAEKKEVIEGTIKCPHCEKTLDKDGKVLAESITVSSLKTNKEKTSSKNSEKSVKKKEDMKKITTLAELKEVKQESLAEVAVASIIETVEKGIEEANKTFQDKQKELVKAQEEATKSAEKIKNLEKQVQDLDKEVKASKAQAESIEKEQKFQTRMSEINSQFELNEKQSAAVAKQIKDLNDEDFKQWVTDFEVFAAKKQAKHNPETCDTQDCPECAKAGKKGKCSTKAEKVDNKADEDAKAEKVLDEAKKEKQEVSANKVDTKEDNKDFTLGEGIILVK